MKRFLHLSVSLHVTFAFVCVKCGVLTRNDLNVSIFALKRFLSPRAFQTIALDLFATAQTCTRRFMSLNAVVSVV